MGRAVGGTHGVAAAAPRTATAREQRRSDPFGELLGASRGTGPDPERELRAQASAAAFERAQTRAALYQALAHVEDGDLNFAITRSARLLTQLEKLTEAGVGDEELRDACRLHLHGDPGEDLRSSMPVTVRVRELTAMLDAGAEQLYANGQELLQGALVDYMKDSGQEAEHHAFCAQNCARDIVEFLFRRRYPATGTRSFEEHEHRRALIEPVARALSLGEGAEGDWLAFPMAHTIEEADVESICGPLLPWCSALRSRARRSGATSIERQALSAALARVKAQRELPAELVALERALGARRGVFGRLRRS